MKYFIIIIFVMLFASLSQADRLAEPVSISNHKFPKGSVEAFSATVLRMARNKDYNSLKPYFHWTWNRFYGSWGPEYPWSRVDEAKTNSDIYIEGITKSKLHKNVFDVGYFSLTEKGERHAHLTIINEDSSYRLAVNTSTSSSIGDLFVMLGYEKKLVVDGFSLVDLKPITEENHIIHYRSPKGLSFRCTFHPKNGTLEKLEQKIGDDWLDLYLVVFDLEKTPSVKLKSH